jgi:hypothetical protein
MALADLPPEDKEIVSALHHLILANWTEAARLAWLSYQEYGRGAVLLDFRPYDTPPETLPFAGYARQQDIDSNDPNLAPLRNLLATYNPQETVVFVIYTPLGDTIIEALAPLEGRPTPAQAAAS